MKTVFFDLDGTLTDPMLGITGCIAHALHRLNQPVPPAEELTWCIGPPLLDSLRQLTNDALAPQALALYRERFSERGLFENTLYEGIRELLTQLQANAYPLYVASSKPVVYVERILEHFELRQHFTDVFGAELDGRRSDKAELLTYALKTTGAAADNSVMVGDRRFDMLGAQHNGLGSIGVTYGYGSREELVEAGANQLVDHPAQIAMALGC